MHVCKSHESYKSKKIKRYYQNHRNEQESRLNKYPNIVTNFAINMEGGIYFLSLLISFYFNIHILYSYKQYLLHFSLKFIISTEERYSFRIRISCTATLLKTSVISCMKY